MMMHPDALCSLDHRCRIFILVAYTMVPVFGAPEGSVAVDRVVARTVARRQRAIARQELRRSPRQHFRIEVAPRRRAGGGASRV